MKMNLLKLILSITVFSLAFSLKKENINNPRKLQNNNNIKNVFY